MIAALLDSGAVFDLVVALPLMLAALVGLVAWAGRREP